MNQNVPERLHVVWSSGDKEVATKIVFMYTLNSKLKGWWDEIELIVWGPSSKLLAHDETLQAEIHKMLDAGVKVTACRACSELYGVTEALEALGIEVFHIGAAVTDYLKSGERILTF